MTTTLRSLPRAVLSLAILVATPVTASADEPAAASVARTTDPARASTLEPKLAETPPPGRTTFDIDPVADGAIIAVSIGFAGMLDLINSTGEIRPQQISTEFSRANLLWIDRVSLRQHVDASASVSSNLALWAVSAFALVDPFLSAMREKNAQTGLSDAFLYAESFAITFGMTNMVKMAVRRPRPVAYLDAELNKGNPNYSNADTDSSLSFFSGHASVTAAFGATATYLAFARAPRSPRPWITLALAVGFSTFVSIERVRAGAHFPTDVIAGTIAGAGVGLVVPHLHRSDDIKQRRVWVGFSPAERGNGGSLVASGIF